MKKVKKRLQQYYDAVKIMKLHNVSLGGAKHYLKFGTFGPWRDSNSPTGWMQKCNYQGNCQHPCNGDC